MMPAIQTITQNGGLLYASRARRHFSAPKLRRHPSRFKIAALVSAQAFLVTICVLTIDSARSRERQSVKRERQMFKIGYEAGLVAGVARAKAKP